jgi:hypothetical protein
MICSYVWYPSSIQSLPGQSLLAKILRKLACGDSIEGRSSEELLLDPTQGQEVSENRRTEKGDLATRLN